MNQIIKNVESIKEKYGDYANTDQKLVLLYLREFKNMRWDSQHISTQDFLRLDINLIQQIIDAKYTINLLEDE